MIAFLVTGISRAGWFHRLGTSFECITWNALNELTAVSKNAVTIAVYQYDPAGRRVEKVAGTTATGWAYDGEDILRQNVTASAVTTTTRFIHGFGVDEPLAEESVTSGATTFLHADGLGSITRHTNASAAITGKRTTKPVRIPGRPWGKRHFARSQKGASAPQKPAATR